MSLNHHKEKWGYGYFKKVGISNLVPVALAWHNEHFIANSKNRRSLSAESLENGNIRLVI